MRLLAHADCFNDILILKVCIFSRRRRRVGRRARKADLAASSGVLMLVEIG